MVFLIARRASALWRFLSSALEPSINKTSRRKRRPQPQRFLSGALTALPLCHAKRSHLNAASYLCFPTRRCHSRFNSRNRQPKLSGWNPLRYPSLLAVPPATVRGSIENYLCPHPSAKAPTRIQTPNPKMRASSSFGQILTAAVALSGTVAAWPEWLPDVDALVVRQDSSRKCLLGPCRATLGPVLIRHNSTTHGHPNRRPDNSNRQGKRNRQSHQRRWQQVRPAQENG